MSGLKESLRGGRAGRGIVALSAILRNLSPSQQAFHIHNKSTLFNLMDVALSTLRDRVPSSAALEIFPPQPLLKDMKIIGLIFAGLVIISGPGKLDCIDLHIMAPNYLLAVPPARETTNRRLAWILTEYRTTSAILTLHIGAIIAS